MSEIVEKLKSIKNSTQSEVEKVIKEHSYKSVIKDLKDAGINPSELSDEEFSELLAEEIAKNKKFASGVAVGAGALLFLDLLG